MTLEYRCSNCGTLLQTTNADAVDAEIERLRAVLAWYADKENYDTGQDTPDILIDGGEVARRALEQKAREA